MSHSEIKSQGGSPRSKYSVNDIEVVSENAEMVEEGKQDPTAEEMSGEAKAEDNQSEEEKWHEEEMNSSDSKKSIGSYPDDSEESNDSYDIMRAPNKD